MKVLDFGLAKALESSTDTNVSNSPTLTLQATQVGIILGTAAYMAPEQARGRAADRRADVFSFGAVLFEILAGTEAFHGESVSDTLAAILKVDPDWSQLPADTPAGIRTLLRRCLTKDRTQRLQAIGEARIVLAQPVVAEPEKAADTKRASSMPWLVTGLTAIVAIVTLWGWLRPRPVEPRPVIRFANAVAIADTAGALALSPDGTRLAFVRGPRQQIFIRSIDQFAAEVIPNTENATQPCFSPDGRWISYISIANAGTGRQLMKTSVAGGPVQKLADWGPMAGPPFQSWGADGNILFNSGGALLRISSSGGPAQTLATPDVKSNEGYYQGLHLLPGGKDVLASINSGPGAGRGSVVAFNVSTGQKELVERVGPARFLAAEPGSFDGYLVWYDATSSSLLAAPFDAKRLEIKAPPVPVIDGIRSGNGPFGTFALSDSGTLAYVPGASAFSSARTFVWVDRQGVEQPTAAPPRQYNGPSLSPDGQFVAVEVQIRNEGRVDIWVYDLARNILSPITSEGWNVGPQWTPDGKRLIYSSGANQPSMTLVSVPADRSAPPSAIVADARLVIPTSVSPDGESVIGTPSGIAPNANEFSVVPLSGRSSATRPFLTSRFRKGGAVFSPNGRWVAYSSNESGRTEIYVSAYPGPGGTTLISDQGGLIPRWSRDGRQLFYRNGPKMMAVDVQLVPTFHAGRPEPLFEAGAGTSSGFDVAPDGKRFLMIKNVGSAVASQLAQLNVVVNWIEELKARVPTK